jgi:hypothetical protein
MRKAARTAALIGATTLIAVLGIPAIASPDVVVTPTIDVTGLENSITSAFAELNPDIATLGTDLGTYESTLLSDAKLSPAEVGAVAALALIEAGGTLPDTCSTIASLEKGIPTSVLGIPISIAEILGLTPLQEQLVTNYLDNLLQTEEQTILTDLSPAALSLLQVNYNTTFFPSGKNPLTPVTRTTRGYIGLPTLLDVDGQPGLDMCAGTEINLGSIASLISPATLSSLGITSLSGLSSLNTTALLAKLGSLVTLSLTQLEVQQQVSKLPLAATTLPVNLSGVLPNLGGIGFGYNTQGSSAPQGYTTTVKIGSSPLLGISDTTSNPGSSLTQTVSLGSTLSINNTWTPVPSAMTTGLTMNGDAFSFPNTVSSPSNWTFGLPLGTTGSITANVNELTSTTASTASMAVSGLGLTTGYSGGTSPSTSFNASIALGADSFGTGVAPLPTSFNSCYVVDAITCSNVNSSRGGTLTALHSMNFTASSPATVTQNLILSAAPTVTAVSPATGPSIGGTSVTITGTGFATNPGGTLIYFGNNAAGTVKCTSTTSCTATVPAGAVGGVNVTASVDGQATASTATPTTYTYAASTGTPVTFPNPGYSCGNSLTSLYAHVRGSDIYEDYNYGTASATLGTGHAWLDTGGTAISGCESALGLVSTYAPGTSAGGGAPTGRLGTFTASSGNAANSLTKSGAMTCPTGTNLNFSLLGSLGVLVGVPSSGDVSNWLCPTPPVNTALPVVTPSSPVYVGSVLNTTNGTWTPTDMASTTTLQWYRCTTATACTQILGSTGSSYAPSTADLGQMLEVVATNTNGDGSKTATSAQTSAVVLPPPPVASTPGPVVSSTVPETVTTTNGTFTSPVPVSYTYVWQLCATPTSCTPITGATSSSLTLTSGADQGESLEATVTATNAGGTGMATSNQFAVPNIPSNSVIPFISDTTQSVSDVSAGGGSDVTQSDTLTANSGTWAPTTGVTYTYVWSHCTTTGTPVCTQVGTGSTYVLAKSDVGMTMQLTVAATDFSGSASATSAMSNAVGPASLLFQTPQSVVDGTVNAVAPDGNGNTYIGGSFDTIGPGVGGAGSISLSSATGKDVTQDARAAGGSVLAVAPDGVGGYFIGGNFTSVQQTPCASLAHITAAGALDAAYCFPAGTGPVNAVDFDATNGVLAVGGSFNVNGDTNLLFFDSTGAMHASGADPNGPVNAVVDDGASFMVGGQFTTLAASTPISAGNLAKWIVGGSGATFTAAPSTTWVQSVLNCSPVAFTKAAGCVATSTPASVDALSIVKEVDAVTLTNQVAIGYYVLIGGSFTSQTAGTGAPNSAAGVARSNAAVITTGTVCAVNPASGPVNPPGGESAAQVQPTTCTTTGAGAVGTWVPNPNGVVRSITSGGVVGASNVLANQQSTPVYLAGDFTKVGAASTPVQGIAEYGLNGVGGAGTVTTTVPTAQLGVNWVASPNVQAPSTTWIPTVSAGSSVVSVKAIAMDANGNLEAGGNFTSVLGQAAFRIVQLTPNTSATSTATVNTAWNPDAGNVVDAIAESGNNVLVGGSFLVLAGSPYLNVAEMDSTGAVVPTWNPGVNGTVDSLAYSNGNVYAGGSFSVAAGTTSTNLAAITSTGSSLGSFVPPLPNGPVLALLAANNTLYVGGNYGTIGGASRNGLSAVDPATGALSSWSPPLNSGGIVRAVAATSSDIYAGGSFSAGADINAGEFNSLSAARTAWNPVSVGAVNAIVVAPSAVYLGGTSGVLAVDPTAGATVWSVTGPSVSAEALSGDGTTLFIGGSFSSVEGVNRGNLADLQTSNGTRTSFNPGASAPVNGMALTTSAGQDTLTVGGAMRTIMGQISGGFGIF